MSNRANNKDVDHSESYFHIVPQRENGNVMGGIIMKEKVPIEFLEMS